MEFNLEKILEKKWKHYLARPFSLFQTSVWNKWYASDEIEEILGVRLDKGLFVEYPKGMVRHYREESKLQQMFSNMEKIADGDVGIVEDLLDRGDKGNKEVIDIISSGKELSLKEALSLSIRVAIVGTVFPYFAGEKLLDKYGGNNGLVKKAISLRAVSYYPKVFSDILVPAAKASINRVKDLDSNIIDFCTVDEIFADNFSDLSQRVDSLMSGQSFVYYCDDDGECVDITSDSTGYIKKIEPVFLEERKEIKGTTGNSGKVVGIVRLVSSEESSVKEFNEGEVLVAVSTNPNLAPLMRKSSAIVTDEGGSLCHAAILSRELGKPCIIGTKVATQVLKDGMQVEVDADNGVVRILK